LVGARRFGLVEKREVGHVHAPARGYLAGPGRWLSAGTGQMDVQSYFSTSLVDMGISDPRFSEIWTPEDYSKSIATGLTEQFTSNAREYVSKYAATTYFRSLFERAIALSDADIRDINRILDLGTGSGDNSAIPCVELFNNCEIIATDLSPNLLAILVQEIKRRGLSDRIAAACVDASQNVFVRESFDLVTGAAILHHLIEPSRAIAAAFRALKPGGTAIFFEPFELGHSILLLAFERIITENGFRDDSVDPNTLHFMSIFCRGVRLMLGRDKSLPIYNHIDDKWLFSGRYFRRVCEKEGFANVRVESIHDPERQITSRASALLSLGAGIPLTALPDWSQQIIAATDSAFCESDRDIIFEGIVTMRKPN
jgi:SAM-dependent methyltransferase